MKLRVAALMSVILLVILWLYCPTVVDLKNDRLNTRRATFGCPQRGFREDVYLHACPGYGNRVAVLSIAPAPSRSWVLFLRPNYDWFEDESLPEEGTAVKAGTPVVLEIFSEDQGQRIDKITALILTEDTIPTDTIHITEYAKLEFALDMRCAIAWRRNYIGIRVVTSPDCFQ